MKKNLNLKLQFFAEPEPQNWGGIFEKVQEATYNPQLFFNTLANENAVTTTFGVLNEPVVNTEAPTAVAGTCNGYPITCSVLTDFQVTANYPIWINEIVGHCALSDYSDQQKRMRIANISNKFAKEEMKRGLDVIHTDFPEVQFDTTSDMNVADRIIVMKQTLISQGYSPKDAILIVKESISDLLISAKLKCCDWQMANGDMQALIGRLMGLKGIYSVEDALMPATVNMMMYIKEYALFNRYCVVRPYFKEASSDNYIETKTRFAGKELVGFAMFDSENSGVVEVDAAPAGRVLKDATTFKVEVPTEEAAETKTAEVVKSKTAAKNKAGKVQQETTKALDEEAKANGTK